MASSDTPGAPRPPDPVVARFKLDNYRATADGAPNEGEVTFYENNTRINDLSGLSFAPSYTAVIGLCLYNASTRQPIDKANNELVDALKAKVARVFDPSNTAEGPVLSEVQRAFPMAATLEKIESTAKDPEERLAKCATDLAVWDSVLSGDDDAGTHPGATLGLYGSRTKFGVWKRLYIVVQSGPGLRCANDFRNYVSKRANEEKGITYGDLARSRQYKELVRLAKRNAHRLVFELLVEVGLVHAVKHSSDDSAITNADGSEVPSKLIRKESIVGSVFSNVLVSVDKNTVGFYSGAVPYRKVRGTLVAVLNPAQGIALYKLSNKAAKGGDNNSAAVERFTAISTSKGHALTPKRVEKPKYDPEVIKKAYVDTGEVLKTFVESRNFDAVKPSSLSQPQGVVCPGEWRILEPIVVIAE